MKSNLIFPDENPLHCVPCNPWCRPDCLAWAVRCASSPSLSVLAPYLKTNQPPNHPPNHPPTQRTNQPTNHNSSLKHCQARMLLSDAAVMDSETKIPPKKCCGEQQGERTMLVPRYVKVDSGPITHIRSRVVLTYLEPLHWWRWRSWRWLSARSVER